MMKHLLIAGLSAAAFLPSLANAQTYCQEQRNDNRVAGTVIGAGIGAILGNAVTSGSAGGTIVGGVGGAVAGNAIAGSATNCGQNQYGYYDSRGAWMPRVSNAQGYYDQDGRWVMRSTAYAPQASANQYGYYDQSGSWVPSVSNGQGYYAYDGRWVASSPAYGPQGSAGYYDGNGTWVAYAAPGYGANPAYAAPGYGQDAAYSDRGRWGDAPLDTRQREDWLEHQIRNDVADGSLDRQDADRAFHELGRIRSADAQYRQYNGGLTGQQQAYIQTRLDNVRNNVQAARGQNTMQTY
jgi:hypothetical protein